MKDRLNLASRLRYIKRILEIKDDINELTFMGDIKFTRSMFETIIGNAIEAADKNRMAEIEVKNWHAFCDKFTKQYG